MKKKWLSVLLGGVFLLSLSATPSVGAPESQSLRRPKPPCVWVYVNSSPGHFILDCTFRVNRILGDSISAEAASNMENDATQALRRIINRYTK